MTAWEAPPILRRALLGDAGLRPRSRLCWAARIYWPQYPVCI